jgi:hypothetical protein
VAAPLIVIQSMAIGLRATILWQVKEGARKRARYAARSFAFT